MSWELSHSALPSAPLGELCEQPMTTRQTTAFSGETLLDDFVPLEVTLFIYVEHDLLTALVG